MESVLPRMKDGRQAFFLFLPDGDDPDSIVRNEGAPGFEARLAQATPLSQFLFDHLAEDGINLATLDGKARLAERAKPMLAQLPDGAFADLMQQRLTELTGVGARTAAPDVHVPAARARRAPAGNTPRRSMVRGAITLLLQRPQLALELQPPYRFVALRQPGIELLTELVAVVSARPDIGTGALLAHFEGRGESAALQKLASIDLPGDEAGWRLEFIDAIAQLDRQTLRQRVDELLGKQRDGGLDEDQTDAILELKLYRLARLEINLIRDELKDKQKRAREILQLLDEDTADTNASGRWKIIREEIEELIATFGSTPAARRQTKIETATDEAEYAEEDFIVAEDCHVMITTDGWIKRQKQITDPSKSRLRQGDSVLTCVAGSTRATIAFFSSLGVCYTARMIDIPASTGFGEPIQKLFKLKDGERIVTAMSCDPRLLGDVVICPAVAAESAHESVSSPPQESSPSRGSAECGQDSSGG